MEINKIYNEDNADTMNRMDDGIIDIILTSPPYNIIRPNHTDRGYDEYKDGMDNRDYIEWTLSMFISFDRILKDNGVVLYNMSYGSENTELMSLTISSILLNSNFSLADIIVWKKNTATPNSVSSNKLTRICEFVYVFCRKKEKDSFTANKKEVSKRQSGQPCYENLFNFIKAPNNDSSTPLNKATFSSTLVRKLLSIYAKPKSLVYDPFIGTGTTAYGCIIDGHNFIGSEISENQCAYANKRISQLLSQLSLF